MAVPAIRRHSGQRAEERPSLGLVAVRAALAACAAAALWAGCSRGEAFAASPWRRAGSSHGLTSLRGDTSSGLVGRRAEPQSFDPFGWKGSLKDTVQGLMDGMSDVEEPSKVEEQMIIDIFSKFDKDGDKILNLEEFNTLQIATEGEEAVYNAEQLKSLLLAVNPDMEDPDRGMPFADYRRLYIEKRLRQAYGTDVRRDHAKIFGADGAAAVEAAVAAATSKEASQKAGLVEGAAVSIEGLTGAVELNGKTGHVVKPLPDEEEMIAEGRLIIQLNDSKERIALKPTNIRASAKAEATQVD